MEVYVYSRQSFSYLARAAASSWDFPMGGYQAASGSVVVAGALSPDYKDNWLLAGGEVWIIDRVEPADGMTTLTIAPGIDAFDRPLIYAGESAVSNGEFLLKAFEKFKSPGDPAYAMSYLDLASTDASALALPAFSEAGLWSLPDYIRSIQDSTAVRLAVSGRRLKVQISPAKPVMHTVTMENSAELLQQTYSRQFTAKVTVVQGGAAVDCYVDAAGAVSASPPSPRLAGEWRVIETRSNKDALEAAREVFSENVASSKISFASPDRYNVGDLIRTRLNGAQTTVKVTAVRLGSSDRRYIYECGELATRLTERLAASESIEALGGVSNKGGGIDGNLGVAGALTAGDGLSVGGGATVSGGLTAKGKVVLNAGAYGTALPTTDLVEGRLFILLEG